MSRMLSANELVRHKEQALNTEPPNRIVVVGTSCSGKSTLGKRLAEKMDAMFIELDDLHWEPNWVEAPDVVFRERTAQAVAVDRWVVAGNYAQVRDIVWSKADTLIWLDYSFVVVFTRMLRRTIRRVVKKEILFAGNIENAWIHLKVWSKESLINWVITTHALRRRQFEHAVALQENAHLKVLRFRRPKETEEWVGVPWGGLERYQ